MSPESDALRLQTRKIESNEEWRGCCSTSSFRSASNEADVSFLAATVGEVVMVSSLLRVRQINDSQLFWGTGGVSWCLAAAASMLWIVQWSDGWAGDYNYTSRSHNGTTDSI